MVGIKTGKSKRFTPKDLEKRARLMEKINADRRRATRAKKKLKAQARDIRLTMRNFKGFLSDEWINFAAMEIQAGTSLASVYQKFKDFGLRLPPENVFQDSVPKMIDLNKRIKELTPKRGPRSCGK